MDDEPSEPTPSVCPTHFLHQLCRPCSASPVYATRQYVVRHLHQPEKTHNLQTSPSPTRVSPLINTDTYHSGKDATNFMKAKVVEIRTEMETKIANLKSPEFATETASTPKTTTTSMHHKDITSIGKINKCSCVWSPMCVNVRLYAFIISCPLTSSYPC